MEGEVTSIPVQITEGTEAPIAPCLFGTKSLLPVHPHCALVCLVRKEEPILF